MSWSFNALGKPSNVATALENYGKTLQGGSKEEFDGVKDALVTLITTNSDDYGVNFSAGGHNYTNSKDEKVGNLNVKIERVGLIV